MARSKKTGLDFYYKSVHDMDDFRVMDLMERYGPVGYVVLDMTMSCVYRNGYYLEMPVKRLAMYIHRYIAGSSSQSSDDIAEIIMYCGEIGLFDRELLGRSVITSAEIQEHYSSVPARKKADKSKYWLLPVENDEPSVETEDKQSPEKNKVFAAKTCVNAAETSVSEDNCNLNSVIIPQSKENKSKAKEIKEDESKANESKANESKANESKAKPIRRVSCDELFPIPEFAMYQEEPASAAADEYAYEYADNYAFACRNEGKEAYGNSAAAAAAGREYEYADKYTGGDSYSDIESAYISVSGKKLNGTDKAFICSVRDDGADDGIIIQAIKKVESRKNREKINSFRYFVPMIREMLKESRKKPDSGLQDSLQYDDGFIHNDTVYEDPYANCSTTEEYLAVLDNEVNCPRAAF